VLQECSGNKFFYIHADANLAGNKGKEKAGFQQLIIFG
jgi:hypothetical protein